jgi:5-hydroxyisourate hydrolase
MSAITTHVLDTAQGKPAQGVPVFLQFHRGEGEWEDRAYGVTNADGRIPDLLPAGTALEAGTYRLTFATEEYFKQAGITGFYPYVPVIFALQDTEQHYHVPLLLSPFGYSTYRGS